MKFSKTKAEINWLLGFQCLKRFSSAQPPPSQSKAPKVAKQAAAPRSPTATHKRLMAKSADELKRIGQKQPFQYKSILTCYAFALLHTKVDENGGYKYMSVSMYMKYCVCKYVCMKAKKQ